jgi:metal-responsive CopG/Arc/MetJ family transcriptional regulator
LPTAKKRIKVSVEDSLYHELEELQKLRGAPSLSSIVIELTKEALELQEDLYFVKIAEKRTNEKEISHKELWK